ncbi:hypothetical protein HAX54_017415 [Datura stramonium]|uniref:Uncharacterized protein n=1 Tax=Datura stramonium TaxID=4076 RepID=A0ABS8UKS5_DATST|nr:hypothetical protein [Datura stramonium]
MTSSLQEEMPTRQTLAMILRASTETLSSVYKSRTNKTEKKGNVPGSKVERIASKTESAKSALLRSSAAEIIKQQSEELQQRHRFPSPLDIMSNTSLASLATETKPINPSSNNPVTLFSPQLPPKEALGLKLKGLDEQ